MEDGPKGPTRPVSTVLSQEEEAIIVGVRRVTRLPLDDCLYALRTAIPNLTRSSLHRCLKRHGISRLPSRAGFAATFNDPQLGYIRLEEGLIHTPEGTAHVISAIDETSRILLLRAFDSGGDCEAAAFLKAVIKVLPYRIRAVFSDDWASLGPEGRWASSRDSGPLQRFNAVCAKHGIAHMRGKLENGWSESNLRRINRTLSQADTTKFKFGGREQLRMHQAAFVEDYNFNRRLKALRGLTPHEFLCRTFAKFPERFVRDPHLDTVRLYIIRGDRSIARDAASSSV